MISLLESCLLVAFAEPRMVPDNIPFFTSLVKKKLLNSKRVKTTKTSKKTGSKFRSPVLSTVSYSRELIELQSKYNRLLLCTKISQGSDKQLQELIHKWKSITVILLEDLRTLIGHVLVDDTLRSLTLLELANSLKFDISIIGNYDGSNDEFY